MPRDLHSALRHPTMMLGLMEVPTRSCAQGMVDSNRQPVDAKLYRAFQGYMGVQTRACAQGAVDSNGQPVDAKLYRAFWGLQAAFRHPYQTLEPARWAAAARDLHLVLDAFARLPIAFGRGAGSSAAELGITVRPCHVLLEVV